MAIPRELLKKIRKIEIYTNRLVNNQLAGQYHSVFKGRGMAFSEVRQYQPGDEIRVRLGPYEHHIVVRALSARRGPASAAAELYEERADSIAAREALALQLKSLHAAFAPEKGRPTKRDRREIEKLRRGGR